MTRTAIFKWISIAAGLLVCGVSPAQGTFDDLIAGADSAAELLFTDTSDQVKISTNEALELRLSGFLQSDESVDFTWDSMPFVKFLAPENGSFAIVTWTVPLQVHTYVYSGFLQKRDKENCVDTVIRLLPAKEEKDIHKSYPAEKWPAAVYNKILPKKKDADFYTLFGWVGKPEGHAGKVIETMAFDTAGMPVFGMPAFAMKDGSLQNRIFFEYTDQVPFHLAWEKQRLPGEKRKNDHMIIFNRIGGNTPGMGRMFRGPVPSYEYFDAFARIGGKWVFLEDVRPTVDTRDLDDRPPKEIGLTPEK